MSFINDLYLFMFCYLPFGHCPSRILWALPSLLIGHSPHLLAISCSIFIFFSFYSGVFYNILGYHYLHLLFKWLFEGFLQQTTIFLELVSDFFRSGKFNLNLEQNANPRFFVTFTSCNRHAVHATPWATLPLLNFPMLVKLLACTPNDRRHWNQPWSN